MDIEQVRGEKNTQSWRGDMRGVFWKKNQYFVFMNKLYGLSIQASNTRKITKCVIKVSEADKPIQIF